MRIVQWVLLLAISLSFNSCKYYSFTGADVGNAKTFQVNFFQNQAAIIEPGIDLKFTNDLQDLIVNQTSLELVTSNADLTYEGEIVQYYIAPITATSQNTAAQNRLTISVQVRFYNKLDDTKDLQQRFSFYFDFDGDANLTGSRRDDVIDEIYLRLTQDIFNATLARW
ncbi:LptE family protein [Gilvibacter sp.]|uniref:LptE family protein n=1 Tax=Gilvibacter sp. TaxID=2729997 RepID=UPI0025C22506|nr:LptE family protein [Gilvibacter sp.]NQX77392.1 LptE family protein [Gilvibacter sp.]